MKKLGYIVLGCILILLINNYHLNANSDINNTKVHLIFNQKSFNKGDMIKLTINLENFTNLNESKVIIKCDENYIEPIKKNEVYGQLTQNSIYEEALLNEYVDNMYLRYHLVKKNLSTGYYSGYKNNLGEFYFTAKCNIINIYDCFINGNFENINCGINVDLFNIYNDKIDIEIKYSEKIKVEWEVDKYIVEVFEELPLYVNDIKVYNRTIDEYELLIEDSIDTNIIGTKTINIAVIDKTNADYLLISKALEIIDITPPCITGENEVTINSDSIDLFNLNDYYQIEDNYDTNVNTNLTYYNNDREIIENYSEFIDYLYYNKEGRVSIISSDNSGNVSSEFIINVNINDITAPNINQISTFEIEDVKVSDFDFSDLITITDNYDHTPTLIYNTYVNGNEVFDYINYLSMGLSVTVKYFGVDDCFNHSEEYTCILTVKDTQKPTINIINDLTINDYDVFNFDFKQYLNVSDNIDKNPTIVVEYYLEDEIIDYDNFIKQISKGVKGKIIYHSIDRSGNMSDSIECIINVIDTTKPVVRIKNIKDGNKYTRIDKIEYEVYDIYDSNIEYSITLNDVIYNNEMINTPGDYIFKIEAVDSSNNKTTEIVEFKIIDNDIVSCGDDVECYVDNYFQIVVISCILMAFVLIIFVFNIVKYKRKKKV